MDKGDATNKDATPESASDTSVSGNAPPRPRKPIRFEEGDPENPNNWGRVLSSSPGCVLRLMLYVVEKDIRALRGCYEWYVYTIGQP